MNQTAFGDIGNRSAGWVVSEMLEHARPQQVLQKFGQSYILPKNSTDTAQFRRPNVLGKQTTALVEGRAPTAQQFTYTDVSVTLQQYGGLVEITDKVADMSEDPVLKDCAEILGEQATLTIEALIWSAIQGGTSVFYGNSADNARTDVNDPISLTRQRAVTAYLRRQKGMKITKILSGSPNTNTTPVEAAYVAVGHTDLESDIRDMTGFTPVSEYGSRQPLSPYEIGSVEDVRYILTAELDPIEDAGSATLNGMRTTGGSNVDVYPVIFLARNAYGCVPLKGFNSITPIVLNPGKPSKSDPLGQVGYVGWKTWFAATVLNDAWMSRLEVGATDL